MMLIYAIAFTGTPRYVANLFIKEVKGEVVHYNYLCALSDPLCGCPEGKECVVGLSDDLYRELVSEGLFQEVDTFCFFKRGVYFIKVEGRVIKIVR